MTSRTRWGVLAVFACGIAAGATAAYICRPAAWPLVVAAVTVFNVACYRMEE